ncbi:MAG: hypothetical protein JXJ04_02075 [Spirochaetales bacterium]|nr:hypothetical protein [Spirochaetales bacterium]
MKKNIFWLLFVLFITFIFIFPGCVGSPEPKDDKESTVKAAPDWFFNPPDEDEKYKYFIGSGTSESGDISEAENNAIRDLMDSIIMFIGVQVDSDTTATARASLDDFSSDISQTVKTTGSARVSGFDIKEKLPHEKEGKITMYLLARYEKKELNKERDRIRKIFEEKYEAISGPEAEGDSFASKKKYYSAALKYIEAAGAASSSDVTNAEIKFERNINKAKGSIEKINLIKINDKLNGLAGEAFPEPFTIKVVSGASEDDPGIPDVVLEIGYKEMTDKGKMRARSQKMKTNAEGILTFDHPIPNFVGSDTVRMNLDFESYMEPLWEVPAQYDEMVDGLDSLIAGKKVVFDYKVESNAKNVTTGIVILDLDYDAAAIKKTETAASLLSALTNEGFKVKLLSIRPTELKDKSDFDIIELLVNKYKSEISRVIFGTARVLSFSNNEGKVFAKSSATVQIVDLMTEEILLTVVKSVNAMGADESAAQSAGFARLGNDIGKEIKNKLR